MEKQLRKSEEEAALAASKLSAKWEEQAAAMSKQIEVAKAAAAELERQLLETEADLATVQAENTQMLEQLQRDALAITELDDEVQVQTGKLEMEKGICSALRTDLDGERASNEAMKSLLEKMERHAEVLKQTLEAVRAELGEAREQTMAAEVHGAEMARAAAAEAKAEAEAAAAECILELEALAREVLGMRRQAEDQMASLAEEGRQICEVAREQLLGLRHDVQRAAALQADLDVVSSSLSPLCNALT